jgi:hypothetical protein
LLCRVLQTAAQGPFTECKQTGVGRELWVITYVHRRECCVPCAIDTSSGDIPPTKRVMPRANNTWNQSTAKAPYAVAVLLSRVHRPACVLCMLSARYAQHRAKPACCPATGESNVPAAVQCHSPRAPVKRPAGWGLCTYLTHWRLSIGCAPHNRRTGRPCLAGLACPACRNGIGHIAPFAFRLSPLASRTCCTRLPYRALAAHPDYGELRPACTPQHPNRTSSFAVELAFPKPAAFSFLHARCLQLNSSHLKFTLFPSPKRPVAAIVRDPKSLISLSQPPGSSSPRPQSSSSQPPVITNDTRNPKRRPASKTSANLFRVKCRTQLTPIVAGEETECLS